MRVEMNRELKDQHGRPYSTDRSSQANGFVPMRLWDLAQQALLVAEDIGLDEMEYRVKLARKIHDAKEPVELDEKEIEKIKEMIVKTCKLPYVVIQARELLSEEV